MRILPALSAALSVVASMAASDAVSPESVAFGEYGEIEVSLSGQPGNPDEGVKVFTTRSQGNCVACHTVTGLLKTASFHGNVGPSLDGVAERRNEAELRGILANAKNVYDGTIMPAFYKTSGYIRPGDAFTTKPASEPLPPLLTAQQIEDVVAYLMTLKE